MSVLAASICITVLQKKDRPCLRLVPVLRLAGTEGMLCAQRPHMELSLRELYSQFLSGNKECLNHQ